ncbi:hypothetical protein ACFSKW_20695 [Nonomuraea mangrovi]|uniref:Uncharacterized protein n=1 Tax=Nonomuraea mangrovi TaxID=2316207 RepID=A0ABW4SYD2_9ACTN
MQLVHATELDGGAGQTVAVRAGGRPAELADILWDMHARRHRHEAGVPAGLLEG